MKILTVVDFIPSHILSDQLVSLQKGKQLEFQCRIVQQQSCSDEVTAAEQEHKNMQSYHVQTGGFDSSVTLNNFERSLG